MNTMNGFACFVAFVFALAWRVLRRRSVQIGLAALAFFHWSRAFATAAHLATAQTLVLSLAVGAIAFSLAGVFATIAAVAFLVCEQAGA